MKKSLVVSLHIGFWFCYAVLVLPLVRYVGCKNEILTSIKYLTKHSVDSGAAPSHGFFPEKKDWDGTFEEVRAKEKAHVAHMNKDVCLAFDTFLGRLTSKKVKVILVYSPEYFENKSFTKNHAEILDMYKKYAQKYNIPMLDYTDDAICYDKKYFVNSTHMNVLGAQLFSQKLAHDIKEMHLADNVN